MKKILLGILLFGVLAFGEDVIVTGDSKINELGPAIEKAASGEKVEKVVMEWVELCYKKGMTDREIASRATYVGANLLGPYMERLMMGDIKKLNLTEQYIFIFKQDMLNLESE